ncbi:unnamed protein product [Mytilus coruscus]|uniref:Uncharacterized protein n=1 Tax=Mytilus coruscus TaxID=42192 RepID=A0A6J8D9Q3_MYTCO|nr:unnamed protein product [Mytilus coruscus]
MSMSASTSRPPSDDEIPHKLHKPNSFHLRFDGSDTKEGELPTLKKVNRTSTPNPKIRTPVCPDEAMGNVSSLMEVRTGVLSELKILSKKVTELDQTVKTTDLKMDQILERLAETNTSKTIKASAAPEFPTQVQQAVRDGFGDAENSDLAWKAKTETGASLKLSINVSFTAGIETYFRSFKNKARMFAAGQMDDHKKKMLKYSRKQRKMNYRLKAVKLKTSWTKEEAKAIEEALLIKYMSSEEDDTDDESSFIVRPLTWRSEEYTNCLRALDAKHKTTLSQQGKRIFNKRKTGAPSTRPRPENVIHSNDWVIRK